MGSGVCGHGAGEVAIPWDALVAVITALVAYWQWKFRASARLDQWPDYLVSDVLPWFLLVVMLLPGTRLLFAGSRPAPAGRRWLTLVSLTALLLLIVVISTLVVDVADWGGPLVDRPHGLRSHFEAVFRVDPDGTVTHLETTAR